MRGGTRGRTKLEGEREGEHSLEIGNTRMYNYTIKIIYGIEPNFQGAKFSHVSRIEFKPKNCYLKFSYNYTLETFTILVKTDFAP